MKGLLRKDVLYAKDMLEKPVRNMFMRMLAWYVGINTNFSVNLGQSYKFLKKYVDVNLWESVLLTYPNADTLNIYDSLMEMIVIFQHRAINVAEALGFQYNHEEAQRVKAYLLKKGADLKK